MSAVRPLSATVATAELIRDARTTARRLIVDVGTVQTMLETDSGDALEADQLVLLATAHRVNFALTPFAPEPAVPPIKPLPHNRRNTLGQLSREWRALILILARLITLLALVGLPASRIVTGSSRREFLKVQALEPSMAVEGTIFDVTRSGVECEESFFGVGKEVLAEQEQERRAAGAALQSSPPSDSVGAVLVGLPG